MPFPFAGLSLRLSPVRLAARDNGTQRLCRPLCGLVDVGPMRSHLVPHLDRPATPPLSPQSYKHALLVGLMGIERDGRNV